MTTSWLNVVDDADDVCVLVWLVEYSRGVVYVTELISVRENREKKVRQGGCISPCCIASAIRAEGMIWGDGEGDEGEERRGMEVKGMDGKRETWWRHNIYACVGL